MSSSNRTCLWLISSLFFVTSIAYGKTYTQKKDEMRSAIMDHLDLEWHRLETGDMSTTNLVISAVIRGSTRHLIDLTRKAYVDANGVEHNDGLVRCHAKHPRLKALLHVLAKVAVHTQDPKYTGLGCGGMLHLTRMCNPMLYSIHPGTGCIDKGCRALPTHKSKERCQRYKQDVADFEFAYNLLHQLDPNRHTCNERLTWPSGYGTK